MENEEYDECLKSYTNCLSYYMYGIQDPFSSHDLDSCVELRFFTDPSRPNEILHPLIIFIDKSSYNDGYKQISFLKGEDAMFHEQGLLVQETYIASPQFDDCIRYICNTALVLQNYSNLEYYEASGKIFLLLSILENDNNLDKSVIDWVNKYKKYLKTLLK